MRLLDRHVGFTVARSFGEALGGLLAVFTVLNLTEGLRAVGGGWTVGRVLGFVALTLPSEAYGLFPAAALLGAVLGLGRLASDREIVAMQAAGWSPLRIARAVLGAAVVLAIGGAVLGELVAVPLSQRAHAQRALVLSGGRALSTASGLWVRAGSRFVNVGTLHPDGSLGEVYEFDFAGGRALSRFTYARAAVPEADGWRLRDLRESTFHDDVATTRGAAFEPWRVDVDPQRLRTLWLEPRDLSLAELVRTIRTLRAQRQNPLAHEVAFWRRVSAPVYMGVMVLLAVPMVMASGRAVRVGERALVAALVGIGFQMARELFTNLGLVAGVSPLAIALLPALVAGVAVAALFRRAGLA
ncbi:MAG: LPS export ABC transporter permease LptG [Deltaproteobacteria bacterium]|nr:LPS export ABC transporter permease LptG [Deltaproteobacteria bacterium]